MIFSASAEVFQPASNNHREVYKNVTVFLNKVFSSSSLNTLEGKLRYVPIIMPAGMRERYPARSKLRKKERIYDCAPQLDYEIFISGTFEDQLREYLRGIALSAPHLAGLGATKEQIAEFEAIIDTAADNILLEQPAETRH